MPGTPIRIDGLWVKEEATYSVDPVPTAANAVRTSQRVWSTLRLRHEFQNLRRDEANASIIPAPPTALPAGAVVELEIVWPIRGFGAAYSALNKPEASPLIRACGFDEQGSFGVGTEKYDYPIKELSHTSCTVYAFVRETPTSTNMLRFIVVGSFGTLVAPINAGERGFHRFRMMGILSAAPTSLAVPSFTYNAQLAPPAVSLGLSIGAWTPGVIAAEYRSNTNVILIRDANSQYGVEFAIAEVRPEFNLQARAVALATYNPFTDVNDRVTRAIALTYGSAQYKRLKLVNTASYLPAYPEMTDDNGFTAYNLTYDMAESVLRFD